MRINTFAFIACIAFCAPAFALEDGEEQFACNQELSLSPALVDAAGGGNLGYAAGTTDRSTLLLGDVRHGEELENYEDIAGAIIFARDESLEGWRAQLPYNGESNIDLYRGSDGAFMLATMWMSEGPGQSWTIVLTRDSFATATCTRVAFPSDLNQPNWSNEFLELVDFDMDARGRGELIGVARLDRDGSEVLRYYSYRTTNGGATWGPPRRLSRERAARGSQYARVEDLPASVGLISELNEAARIAAGGEFEFMPVRGSRTPPHTD